MAKKKRYGKEFKLGAARLVVEQGYTRADAPCTRCTTAGGVPHRRALVRIEGCQLGFHAALPRPTK